MDTIDFNHLSLKIIYYSHLFRKLSTLVILRKNILILVFQPGTYSSYKTLKSIYPSHHAKKEY